MGAWVGIVRLRIARKAALASGFGLWALASGSVRVWGDSFGSVWGVRFGVGALGLLGFGMRISERVWV